MQFSWVVSPGWSNAHRPCCGGGGCRAKHDGGWGLSPVALAQGDTSNESRVTSNEQLPCHCEGARNVENVVVRLRQSSYNMSAGIRPQCFFYLLDRHAPLAMTKGSNSPSTHRSCHSRARGPRKHKCVCGVVKAGILYLFSNNFCHSRVGGNRVY